MNDYLLKKLESIKNCELSEDWKGSQLSKKNAEDILYQLNSIKQVDEKFKIIV